MTVTPLSAHLSIESPKTDCGRCSCIILYSSEKCILCDVALEILYSVISDFGLPASVIKKVDILNDDDGSGLPLPVGLPAIRICQDVITGLPDMDTARSAVMHAILNGCFSDCQ
ncbi:MAG: hypothetical protein E4H14_14865 [Candidatus Thorarchaeota archaeon]|nr:MAG: hypothetical protein E4H14_14865 [Candidatus Thorarchaeota archaeon]